MTRAMFMIGELSSEEYAMIKKYFKHKVKNPIFYKHDKKLFANYDWEKRRVWLEWQIMKEKMKKNIIYYIPVYGTMIIIFSKKEKTEKFIISLNKMEENIFLTLHGISFGVLCIILITLFT